jgi:C4-dicarboxylate-binding protein DctP
MSAVDHAARTGPVRRALNVVDWFATLLVVLAATMAVVVTAQVGLCYVLNQSFGRVEESSRLLYVWSILLATHGGRSACNDGTRRIRDGKTRLRASLSVPMMFLGKLYSTIARSVGRPSRGYTVCFRTFCVVHAAFCLAGASSVFAETTTLQLSLPIAIDSPVGLNIRYFAREVEARTNGAVKIEILGKDRWYEENEIVSAVSSGAIQIGATPLNQFAYDVPLAAAFLQPFLFNFDALVQAATKRDSAIRALIEEEILYWTNTRVLWWQPYGSSVIFTRKISSTNPKAILDRAVGTPDDHVKELIKACGGKPYLVAPPDLFTELQKGTIEATATDIMNVTERELWRVADTVINTQHAPSLFMIVINDKAWQRLAGEHQTVLRDVAQGAQERMWERFATIKAEAYAFAIKKGMTVIEVPADDIAAWRVCTSPLLDAYMERTGAVGPKLFEAYGKLRTEECCREAPGDRTFRNR